ncbi:MAG TPA: hypothetical protein VF695_00980 [Sphingomonas sp.]
MAHAGPGPRRPERKSQTAGLHEQAERYGLPIGGPTIDLPKLARRLHDFLAENAAQLAKEPDELMVGGSSPALERYREERAALARLDRLDRLERENVLLPRDQVREALGRIAAVLRAAGESLQRQYGGGAAELLHEAIDDAEREMKRTFGEEQTDDDQDRSDSPDPA